MSIESGYPPIKIQLSSQFRFVENPIGKTKVNLAEVEKLFIRSTQVFCMIYPEQKEYLIQVCFGWYVLKTVKIGKCFAESDEKETFIWSEMEQYTIWE